MSSKICALASLVAYYSDSDNENEVDDPQAQSSLKKGLVEYVNDDVFSDDEYEDTTPSTETAGSSSPASDESPMADKPWDLFDSDDELGKLLPPLTTAVYPAEKQAKIDQLLKQVEGGLDLNAQIQSSKEYRNPAMYSNMIKCYGIDEFGSNCSPGTFDLLNMGKESFYEALAHDQQDLPRRLHETTGDQSCKRKAAVQIVSGTVKIPKVASACTRDANINENIRKNLTIDRRDRKKRLCVY